MNNLTQTQIRELFDYDAENGILLRRFKYGLKPCGTKPNSNGRGLVRVGSKVYLVHRLIWLWWYGSMPKNEIDHIDRNPMNNRIDNLRDVSASQNQHNASLRSDNKTGYQGVSIHTQTGKYVANIRINNKMLYLGLYKTSEEAFMAYVLAKLRYHPDSPRVVDYVKVLAAV